MTASAERVRDIFSQADLVVLSEPDAVERILSGECKHDVDILLPPSARRFACNQLEKLGFHLELKRNSPGKALYFQYWPEQDHLLMLDLYWRFVLRYAGRYYELRPDITEALLKGAVKSRYGFHCLTGVHRLFMILCSVLIKGNKRERYQSEIGKLTAEIESLRVFLERTVGLDSCTSDVLYKHLTQGEPLPETAFQAFVAAAFRARYPLIAQLGWLPGLLRLRLRHDCGLPPLVAVNGIDGSGKSTLIAALERRLPVKARSIYWASRNMLLPTTRLHRWLERRLLGQDIRDTSLPEQKYLPETAPSHRAKRSPVRALVRWPALFLLNINKYLEYLAKYILATQYRLRGSIVITDRYVYDEFLEYSDSFYRVNRWIYWNLYPRPELQVLALAPAELIHLRKPSIPEAIAAYHCQVYRELGEDLKKKGVVVVFADSSNEVEANVKQVLRAVFSDWC